MPRPNAWQSAQAVIGIGLAAAILYWGVPWFGETTWPEIGRHLQLLGWASSLEPVSYTHLTLPTICSV